MSFTKDGRKIPRETVPYNGIYPSLSPSSSTYLMNDIPRGTRRGQLLNSLRAPTHEHATNPPSNFLPRYPADIVTITNSRLHDELSVARIHFTNTPNWLQRTNNDSFGFPKKVAFGTLWRPTSTDTDEHGQTEFIRAVIKGGASLLHAEMMAEFEDTDVNIQDAHGRTALHWACVEGHVDMVRLCLSVPQSEIGLQDNDGYTAFEIAQQNGNDLVAEAFHWNILDMEKSHPQEALLRILTLTTEQESEKVLFPGDALFRPVAEGNELLVEALIARGIDLTVRNEHGDTALHVAAAHVLNFEIVTMLLEAGCDVDEVGGGGATPLHYAVRVGDWSVVALLLRWKATPDARDGEGNTPQELAEKGNKEYLVAEFKASAAGREEAVNLPGVRRHLKRERTTIYRTNLRNEDGLSALQQVVQDGEQDTVRKFLSRGDDIEGKDKDHRTALHIAVEKGNAEIVTLLLAGGANIEAVTICKISPHLSILSRIDSSMTALQLAARYRYPEIVNILLAGGANISAANDIGHTALHFAAAFGYTETAMTLLSAGAEIDVWGLHDGTPLYCAAQNGQTATVLALLANGANIKAEGRDGTPLRAAWKSGHRELATILVAHGAQRSELSIGYRILNLLGLDDAAV